MQIKFTGTAIVTGVWRSAMLGVVDVAAAGCRCDHGRHPDQVCDLERHGGARACWSEQLRETVPLVGFADDKKGRKKEGGNGSCRGHVEGGARGSDQPLPLKMNGCASEARK